jgi:hypothetical protein
MNVIKKDQGSIVLESAIILPFFLAFVLAMISFVQIATAEIALQSAVSETTKQIAAHIYPLYVYKQSEAGKKMLEPINYITNISQDYSSFIPGALANMMQWTKDTTNQAFLPVLWHYSDKRLLQKKGLTIQKITFPGFNPMEQDVFSMTVTYHFKLMIPFMSKELRIHKTAYEYVWVRD